MAEVIVLEFTNPDAGKIYTEVNGLLGWKGAPDAAHRPAGLMSSIAGESGDKLIVVEVWRSKADQERFMQKDLGPALAKAKAPPPTSVRWFNKVIDFQLPP